MQLVPSKELGLRVLGVGLINSLPTKLHRRLVFQFVVYLEAPQYERTVLYVPLCREMTHLAPVTRDFYS